MPNFRKEPNLILLSASEFGVQFPSIIPKRMHWLGGTQTQREPYWHKQLIWALDDNSVNVAKAGSDVAQQVLLPTASTDSRLALLSTPQTGATGVGCARLTPDELLHRIRAGQCLYYGHSGHFFSGCGQKTRLISNSGVLTVGEKVISFQFSNYPMNIAVCNHMSTFY